MATATPYHREGYSHGKYEGSYVPIWRLSSVSISSVYSMLLRKKWGNKIYSLKFQKKKKKQKNWKENPTSSRKQLPREG